MTDALNVRDCPASRFVGAAGAIVTESPDVMVTSPESIEFALVGVVALSVTITFDFSVLPTMLVLEVNANELDDESWFAIIVCVTELNTTKL